MALVMEAVIRLPPLPSPCMRAVLCKPFYLATSFCGGAAAFGREFRCMCLSVCVRVDCSCLEQHVALLTQC